MYWFLQKFKSKKENANNKLVFFTINITELNKSLMLSLMGGSVSEDRPTNTFTTLLLGFSKYIAIIMKKRYLRNQIAFYYFSNHFYLVTQYWEQPRDTVALGPETV